MEGTEVCHLHHLHGDLIDDNTTICIFALWWEESVAEFLAAQFKEHEDHLHVDLIDTLTKLLWNTVWVLHSNNRNNSIVILMKETYIPKLIKKITTVVKPSSSQTECTQTSILYLLTTICSTPQGLGSTPQITAVRTTLNFSSPGWV